MRGECLVVVSVEGKAKMRLFMGEGKRHLVLIL